MSLLGEAVVVGFAWPPWWTWVLAFVLAVLGGIVAEDGPSRNDEPRRE